MRIVLSLILALAFLPSYSQGFKSGLQLGLNTSQVSGDALGGFHKAGLKAGAFVKHRLQKSTNLQFELYYIDKGSNDNKTDFQIDLSYVETALILQKFHHGLMYEGGLTFGVNMSAQTYNMWGFEDQGMSDFNSYDIGAKIGIGKELKDKLWMYWELGNTLPFFPIQAHPSGETYRLNLGKYNAVLCFSFRYMLSK